MGAQGSGQQVQTPPDERLKDSTEIQGNILAPFNKPHQMFLFLNFRNSQRGARQWLATITDKHRIATTRAVTEHNAEYRDWKARDDDAPQPTSVWMAVGLTSWGLVTLHPELATDLVVYDAFWRGPLGPATDEHGNWTASPALLGDEAMSDPSNWVVGGPDQDPVDALVTLAADDEGELDSWAAAVRRHARLLGLHAMEVRQRDGTTSPGQRGDTLSGPRAGTEQFGFRDGVSQPGVRGFTSATFRNGRWESEHHPGSPIIATGEFVLGYQGERGSYPDARRPVPSGWMRGGSFQVFLRLTQDVVGWRDEMDRLGGALSEDVAAKVIGRRADGTALAPGGGGRGRNDFTYADDPDGDYTPRFAHIRKANPRDDRTHRLLRRGLPFGPPLDGERAGAAEKDVERGLLLNAFMASIEHQFEFTQRNWASNPLSRPSSPGQDGLASTPPDGPDPLVGSSTHPCVLRREGEEPVRLDLRRFVRTTGAVYAFAPSISALRRLGRGESMREG
jgi:Dyp-type peroxidase family